jgi:hypothetical protein
VFPLEITSVRVDGTNFVSGNLQRGFGVRERYRIQFRVDVLNVLNKSQFNGPITDPTSTNFGKITSQSSLRF